jgi:ABC-type transporter Mla subunit MlaD
MTRRNRGSIVANPVLVGSVTALVVVVAVFLAYNANAGLPFVPTTQLNVQLPNGNNLLAGNDVREGGERIGIVDRMRAVPMPDGSVGAEAVIKLDKTAGTIPLDSTVTIRPRSVLGLKYLDIHRGKSDRSFGDGDTLPVEQSSIPVELDQFNNIFDKPTRDAVRDNLTGFGNAFSSRGVSLNRTIEDAPRFLTHLEPVMAALADRRTELGRFFRELGDFTRTVAPVAAVYAHQFTVAANTFEAWSRDPAALEGTLQRSAPTMRRGIESFRVQRPFLTDLGRFSTAMKRATDQLPYALPRATPALQAGTRVLPRTPEVNERLREVLEALRALAEDPRTGIALRALTHTVGILNPLLRFVGPYITVCNYFNYAWTNAGEHISEPDPTGYAQRTLLNQAGRQDNSVTSIGASEPANGKGVISGTPQFLHSNVYTAAVDRQGNADCESGQRGYVEKATAYNNDPNFKIANDPHLPGSSGPTFSGRPRVLPGQTFDRAPGIGPTMPPEVNP